MKNLSYSKLGTMGNLGNQLFEIASTIGLARKNGMNPVFPEWQYEKFFKGPFPCQANDIEYDYRVVEPHYHFAELSFDVAQNVDISGWLQSSKYWKHCEDEIRDMLQWNPIFLNAIKERYAHIVDKPFVAVSVRRGDYVGNTNYAQVDADWYTSIMATNFGPEVTYVIFSDDFEWCKKNIGSFYPISNIVYAEHLNAIEQLCFGSLANNYIIANSSFAWWMAYLGNQKNEAIVFVPKYWNDGNLLQHSNDKDVKISSWFEFDNTDLSCQPKIIALSDVTFTIPVKIEHQDRDENLELTLEYLNKYFKTNIIITEQDDFKLYEYRAAAFDNLTIQYQFEEMQDSFERTRLLNDMAHQATTPIVVNWDTDVFIDPKQIVAAVNLIRENKVDGVYPYDGRFYRCSRNWYRMFSNKLDVNIFQHVDWPHHQENVKSYGGAIFWNKAAFIQGGMENQFMVHYGPEDYERYERFKKLGYRMARVKGPLYHLDHHIGNNGSLGHSYLERNHAEFEKIQNLTADELKAYVATWPWKKGSWGKIEQQKTTCGLSLLPVDQIWCLTLDHRKDRQVSARKEFEKIGQNCFDFFPAVDGVKEVLTHPDELINAGMRGCFESHKAMLKTAIDNGYECILITEDDLKFIDGFNEYFSQCMQSVPDDWQFLYLGHYENNGGMDYKEKVNNFWVIPNAVWGTHGYVVRGKEVIQQLYDLLAEQHFQVDVQICRFLEKSNIKHYASFPSVIFQDFKNLPTDIQVPIEQKLI